jgi:hemoglobin
MDRQAVSAGTVTPPAGQRGVSNEDAGRTPYQMLGDRGIRDLANAFYDVMDALPEAAPIRAMHGRDLGNVKRMLAAWLTQWMGGPPVYLAIKGSVCLTAPHAPYAIGPAERDMWLRCMDLALERVGASDELKNMLREPLRRVADTVRNRDHGTTRSRDPNIIAVG